MPLAQPSLYGKAKVVNVIENAKAPLVVYYDLGAARQTPIGIGATTPAYRTTTAATRITATGRAGSTTETVPTMATHAPRQPHSRTLFTLQSCPVYAVGALFVLLLIAALVVVAFRRRMAAQRAQIRALRAASPSVKVVNVTEVDDEKASLVV
jgi:hypothetical protein